MIDADSRMDAGTVYMLLLDMSHVHTADVNLELLGWSVGFVGVLISGYLFHQMVSWQDNSGSGGAVA